MKIHDLKTILQRQFGDGLAIVVGSGLSCAEGMPSMSELATYLITNVKSEINSDDENLWAEIKPRISVIGLESALLEKPPSPTLESNIVSHTTAFISNRERAVLEDVFSGKKTLRLTKLTKHLLKPASGIPIITTNYDRLVEVAVEEGGLGVDTMFVGNFSGSLNETESRLSFCRDVKIQARGRIQFRYRPRANVYKPHGSLDWYLRDGNPVRYAGELSLPRLLITPGLNKFRNGYESPFDRHRDRANSAIDKASRLLIIGYGFNDDHLETHLKPRIREGMPTLMLAKELSSNALALAKSFENVVALYENDAKDEFGTCAIVNREVYFYPGISIWDLNSFISEVLKP